jgi:hypothetical protein
MAAKGIQEHMHSLQEGRESLTAQVPPHGTCLLESEHAVSVVGRADGGDAMNAGVVLQGSTA